MLKRINYLGDSLSFDLCLVRTWATVDGGINSGAIDYYDDISLEYEVILKNFEKMRRICYGYITGSNETIRVGQNERAAERLYLIERSNYLKSLAKS